MHRDKPYDEFKMLELLAGGSEYAFTQLFDYYRPRIYRSALKFLKSEELAEEVVQEVFLKVWQKREDVTKIRNFNAYIFVMTRNLVFDNLKMIAEETAAAKDFAMGLKPENGTEKLMLEKQYEDLLNKAVEKLPPQQKLIFKMARFEGLSHEQMAKKLMISRLTVKKHMATALQFIRLQMQDHLNEVILAVIFFCS